MPRAIEQRASFDHPADRVLAALVDQEFLRERLAWIGGSRSELVSHDADGQTVRTVMRQEIDAQHLPGVVRRVAPNGVVVERTEIWRIDAANPYQGTISAAVGGMPGSLQAASTLRDAGGQSELAYRGSVKIGLPLIGGKVEEVIAGELGRLLAAEATFTNRWLESRA